VSLGLEFLEVDEIVKRYDRAEKPKGMSKYIPHCPHPRQAQFLALTDLEALYGGAAAGGKSDALLMGALSGAESEPYSALVLRRTFRDLNQPGAIMDRCHSWLRGTDAHWVGQDKRFTFPSGASVTFGYLDNERDLDQYQSAEFQRIYFDELTHFPERWYRYLFSRIRRREGSSQKLEMRAATNPGGIGHAWVKSRFIDASTRQAPFIPARLDDNPSADAEAYRESLSKLDEITRRQLEDGVWEIDANRLVYRFDAARNCVDIAPPCSHRVLALDYGYTDATSATILEWGETNGPDSGNVYVTSSEKRTKMTPSESAEWVRELEGARKFDRIVGDLGGLGKGYGEEARRRFGLPIDPADKNNKLGYIKLLNGEFERSKVYLVRSKCSALIKEYQELPWADDLRMKEAESFDNHCADGALYGWRATRAFVPSGQKKTASIGTKYNPW
jgi:terminase large subunit-like protein